MRKLIFPLFLFIQTLVYSQQFRISYTPGAFNGPFTGKVYLYLSKDNKHPKDAFVGLEAFPCLSVRVENIKPGGFIMINDKATAFPVPLSDMERGEYYVQAVWDRDLGGRAIAASPGNLFNNSQKVIFTKDFTKTFTITCDKVVPVPTFIETRFVKELKVPSALLSSFHHKPMTVNGAVILPKEYYDQPSKKFPVLFIVSGYGGDYHYFSGDTSSHKGNGIDTIPWIGIFLDGNCSLGHSVYANSDNNGPWGDALTKEFIPTLENKYRCNGARYLRGHSSGGWTVLWLQTHYPTVFDGCWSSSPDPVDFRDFQKINLYEDASMFYGKDSALRSVATVAGFFQWVSMKTIYRMEKVIDRGEQMHSFDAVFSAKDANGNPERICNNTTGEINKKVVEHWKNYDISLYLRTNWASLKDDLSGKIRVSVGEQDNFLLNGAVHMLDKEMKTLGADMQFEYFPGDHFTVSSPDYISKGFHFLANRYKEWEKKNGF